MKFAYIIHSKSVFGSGGFKEYLKNKVVKDRKRVKRETIDEILKIIDNYTMFRCKAYSNAFEAIILRPNDMKNAIKALKGGEQG